MIRLGMLTPSSNTVLEPMTARLLANVQGVSAHFARFRVVQIGLSAEALGQFDVAPVLEAARLLADAKVDVIAWNGTSAGWLGFDSDVRLCAAITEATGIQATSAVLALNAALARFGCTRLGLVTPYLHDVQARILANYAAAGIDIVAERHLNDPGNFSFAAFTEAQIEALVRAVAEARPQAIAVLCTNMRGTALAAPLEAALGVPILDSIAVTLWHCLVLAGLDPALVRGWGRLFSEAGSAG